MDDRVGVSTGEGKNEEDKNFFFFALSRSSFSFLFNRDLLEHLKIIIYK